MPKLTFIEHSGKEYHLDVPEGVNVMQAALNNDVRGILADCGGACSCATCHGYISPDWAAKMPQASDAEQAMIECAIHETPESRLTCQIKMTAELDGLVVRLPISQL